MEAAITPRTRALFLGFPNNPTGAVLEPERLRALAAIAERHDLLVISDEVYDRLVYGGHRHEAFSAMPGMRERTILLGGFSKAYAMTGWRIGYACAPADLLEGIVKIHQYIIMSAPTIAQDAALVALEEAEAGRASGWSPSTTVAGACSWPGSSASGSRHAEPRGAFYAFPSIAAERPLERGLQRAAPLRAPRGGHPGERLRAQRRGLRARFAGDVVREAGGGAGAHRAVPRRSLSPRSMTLAPATEVACEPVIGIEVHVQLRTASKMFCGCATVADAAGPNRRTCPICLGLPGALPVLNREAVRHVLTVGLAIDARIPEHTRWDRKNYFYPDLPKGYQISQYELPLASAGRLRVETADGPVDVGITRAHLEEDTARLDPHAPGGPTGQPGRPRSIRRAAPRDRQRPGHP